MISAYDYWLISGPGGPYDPAYDEQEARDQEIEQAARAFHRLDPRARAKARRMAKRSTERRRMVPAWRARQRREDINSQVIY